MDLNQDNYVHIDQEDKKDVYFVNLESRSITKFPRDGGSPTIYVGYPVACSCPSYDHRKSCKHLGMWSEASIAGTLGGPPVAQDQALAAFSVLASRAEGAVRFHSMARSPDGHVRAVNASCSYPELAGQVLVGRISGVLLRVFGAGRSPA